jgi:hypothetical protein
MKAATRLLATATVLATLSTLGLAATATATAKCFLGVVACMGGQ